MSREVINHKMWACLIWLLMGSYLMQVDSLNSTDSNVTGRKLQNTNASDSLKTVATEQNSKLTLPDDGKIHIPSENKSTITSTTSSTEPFISFPNNFSTGALLRGFYVLVGLGAIVVIYIVVRTIRLRKTKKTVRKYGVLANREDVEMTPLGAEEEEEESTLFDMTVRNSNS